MKTEDYDTMSGTINTLRGKGYTEDFNLLPDCIECKAGNYVLSPKDFQVDEVFRFEGPTDPGDSAILYAISSPRRGVKGVLVNAYGIYADATSNDMVEKLKIQR